MHTLGPKYILHLYSLAASLINVPATGLKLEMTGVRYIILCSLVRPDSKMESDQGWEMHDVVAMFPEVREKG